MTTYARIGSISSGTLRPEDLIPSFIDALDDIHNDVITSSPKGFDATEECNRLSTRITDLCAAVESRMIGEDGETNDDYFTSEEADWDMESLTDLLNEFAPPYTYFGTHEGDGSDFGFWISWDSITDDEHDGRIVRIDAGDEWPELAEDVDYVLEVNDHGNATLYNARDHTEVWAVV